MTVAPIAGAGIGPARRAYEARQPARALPAAPTSRTGQKKKATRVCGPAWPGFYGFAPDAGWTWYATGFDGQDTFFGLAEGQEKALGYFSLSELESVRGPMGLAVERDLHFQPQTLEEIAPETFAERRSGS